MKKKILGDYSWAEVLLSTTFFSLLVYIDYWFFKIIFSHGDFSEKDIFTVLATNMLGLLIVSLPYLRKKAECLSNKRIEAFLDLPEHGAKVSYSTISSFLGDQALASFLATVLIFTGKGVFETYGGITLAFYVIPLSCIALMLASISLIRFITHFTKLGGFLYAVASTLAAGVTFAFFNIGLKLGA